MCAAKKSSPTALEKKWAKRKEQNCCTIKIVTRNIIHVLSLKGTREFELLGKKCI